MQLFKVFLLTLISILSNATAQRHNKYNVSLTDMSTCQEYFIRGVGYMYADFFHLKKLTNTQIQADELLHLKFYVQTAMDAHILMSVTDSPRQFNRVYEIVIGAGGNTFSAIRTSMGRRRVATNQDPQLLSVFDPTPIEIIQKKDGVLSVYIPGYKAEPLLTFTDESPLDINYISFSSFGSITARWFYDCKFDGFEAEIEEELRLKTPRQRLLADIVSKAANQTMPTTLNAIEFAFEVYSVTFKEDASILNTRLDLFLYWNDPKLEWDPSDYDYIDVVVQPDLDIWLPKLAVLNGALDTFLELRATHEVKVHANGSVVLQLSNAELKTWCLNTAHNWPAESVTCNILLSIVEFTPTGEEPLRLQYDNSSAIPKESINMLSDWRCLSLGIAPVTNGNAKRLNAKGIVQTMGGDVFIELKMQRNGAFYKSVFVVPVYTAQTLIILSFLLRGYRRGALLLVVVLIICLGLMLITKHAPSSYVPKLLIAYQHILRIATLCYILHIAIMWLELFPPKSKPSAFIMSTINCSPLRLMLCMRYSDSSDYVDIQERPWRDVGKILNNTSFIIVNIFLIVNDVKYLSVG